MHGINILKLCCWFLLFKLGFVFSLKGQQLPLAINKPALPLVIGEWVQGNPVDTFEKGMVYIVEFTGPHCPACVMAIPILNGIAKEYAGQVTVVAIYVDPKESPFSGDKRTPQQRKEDAISLGQYARNINASYEVSYTVGVDVPHLTTKRSWEIFGTPTVFVVDQSGVLVARCKPNELNELLPAILEKQFDALQFQEKQEVADAKYRELLFRVAELENEQDFHAALDIVEICLADAPANGNLHDVKYRLLLSIDSAKASQHLEWILQNVRDNEIVWNHLIEANYRAKHPNLEQLVRVLERSFAEAKTDRSKIEKYLSNAFSMENNIIPLALLKGTEIPLDMLKQLHAGFYENALEICNQTHENVDDLKPIVIKGLVALRSKYGLDIVH